MADKKRRTSKIDNEKEKVKIIEGCRDQMNPINAQEIAAISSERYSSTYSAAGYENRISFLQNKGINLPYLTGSKQFDDFEALRGNTEHYIGMAQVPTGVAGPMQVNGTAAKGAYYVPLATTEGALIASYNRGMKACLLAGGVTAVCLVEGIQRSPFFKFGNIGEVGQFLTWIHEHENEFQSIVSQNSRFAQLNDIKTNVEGNAVIITFEYTTGDASGQNMVTICTDKICQYILESIPVKPSEWYIESNNAGDKKATALSFSNVRGKKVTTEIILPEKIVRKNLHTTPDDMAAYWQSSTLAVTQSGSIGAQGHVANGLTALFIACGQDVACIAESSVGITRMQCTAEGNLYVAVTLPSLLVGTVGGGTGLPTQQECLGMLGCQGPRTARKFAEICGAVALAGEVSIAAAMAANHFTRAHKIYGRKKA